MGEEKEHSRFTLVTAGGTKSRGVAFRSPPERARAGHEATHDIALRLEKNRWNGVVEPRVLLRALCPTEPGELRVLGEDGDFWDELRDALAAPSAADGCRPERVSSRTAAARASPASRATCSRAASPCSSRWRTCRAGARASRPSWPGSRTGRCRSSPGPRSPPSRSWPAASTTSSPSTRRPAASPTRSSHHAPRAHLAWGPAEAEFAITAYRAALDLRPAAHRGLPRPPRSCPPRHPPPTSRPRSAEPAATRAARRRLRAPARCPDRAEPDRARPRAPAVRISTASAATSSSRRPTARPATSSPPPSARSRPSCSAPLPGSRRLARLAAARVDVEVVDRPGAEAHRADPELHRRVLAGQQRQQVRDHENCGLGFHCPCGSSTPTGTAAFSPSEVSTITSTVMVESSARLFFANKRRRRVLDAHADDRRGGGRARREPQRARVGRAARPSSGSLPVDDRAPPASYHVPSPASKAPPGARL